MLIFKKCKILFLNTIIIICFPKIIVLTFFLNKKSISMFRKKGLIKPNKLMKEMINTILSINQVIT